LALVIDSYQIFYTNNSLGLS